jgi:hypothetical protein
VRPPLLPLRPFVGPGLAFAVLPAVAALAIGWPVASFWIVSTLLFLAIGWRRFRWYWTLAASVRTFRTLTNPWVTLHYSPRLENPVALRALHKTVESELHSLARRFGRPLRIPVTVYLFDHTGQVAHIFGPQYGGFALWDLNAIVVAADCPSGPFVRHELGHLFAGRWSKLAPPLLQEGLAVWLEGTRWGQPLDPAARNVLGDQDVGLSQLMDRGWFFTPEHMDASYALAGSFSAFLIQRFGWEAYGRLYRQCDGRRFPAKFHKCFGMSLEDAHWEWRLELRLAEY